MKANDFSVPRRMSGSAFWVLMAKGLRAYASIFVILIVMKLIDTDDYHGFFDKMRAVFMLCAAYLAVAALTAFISWYFKKYYVEGGKLVFIHGIISKETTSIPLSKVQSMRTKQGFIYSVLELRGVLFDTLASKSAEIELILDDRDWKALMARVEMQEAAVADEESVDVRTDAGMVADEDSGSGGFQGSEIEEPVPGSGTDQSGRSGGSDFAADGAEGKAVRMRFSNSNLIKGAFCQNHLQGMAVLFAALAAVYNTVSNFDDHAVDHIIDYVDTHAGTLSLQPSGYAAFAAALYFFVMLLWIGKVFLRYANMEVRMARGYLTFESGLISRDSSRFSYDKVCTVYVKRNFLEKRLHGSTVILRQALNATDEKGGTDVRVYGSDSADDFLTWWLGDGYCSSAEVISARSGYGLIWHVMRIDVLLSMAAAVALACFGLYQWIVLPAAWLLVSMSKGVMAVRRSRITLKEDYIEIHNGKFADIRNYVKYGNVEVVRLKATPMTAFFHRVSLTFSTNGTTFTLRSLKEQEAREVYERLPFSCK